MAEVEVVCTECERFLGRVAADAPDAERERFWQGLRDQGFTPVHHFGWFCSRACGEAFFRRQREAPRLHPFVFRFAYETPRQQSANAAGGWDDESSQWVVIDAPDEAAALAWGREVAERFVRELGGGSWQAGNFAHWVEPLPACPWAVGRQPVAVGQLPKFAEWV